MVIYNSVHEMQLSVNHLYGKVPLVGYRNFLWKKLGEVLQKQLQRSCQENVFPEKVVDGGGGGGGEEEKRGGRIGAPKESNLFGGPEKEWLPAYLLRRTEEPFEFERIMSSSDKNVYGTIY